MADENGGSPPSFRVSADDCQRWAEKLNRMAKALEKKEQDDKTVDGTKMFYTAAVMLQKLAFEISQDQMVSEVPDPFGTKKMGEC